MPSALATTAEAGDATRARLVEAGFADVIAKPVTVDALRSALARICSDADEPRAIAADASGDVSSTTRARSRQPAAMRRSWRHCAAC